MALEDTPAWVTEFMPLLLAGAKLGYDICEHIKKELGSLNLRKMETRLKHLLLANI